MGDGYYQGDNVDQSDADNFGSNWTADELIALRDSWRRMSLTDLALSLGRTEGACRAMYYHHLRLPMEQRWKPAASERAAFQASEDQVVRDTRPVNTIHADEDRWWEPGYYTDNTTAI